MLPHPRSSDIPLDNRGVPGALPHAEDCCAPLSSCRHSSASPLPFSPPLFHHLLSSRPPAPCSPPLLALQALPAMHKVKAPPQREPLLTQSRAGLGPATTTYALSNLSAAPTCLRGLSDTSIAEREKPRRKWFCASSCYFNLKASPYWGSKRINTPLQRSNLLLNDVFSVRYHERREKALSCQCLSNRSQHRLEK